MIEIEDTFIGAEGVGAFVKGNWKQLTQLSFCIYLFKQIGIVLLGKELSKFYFVIVNTYKR